jgi:hypothetical protein
MYFHSLKTIIVKENHLSLLLEKNMPNRLPLSENTYYLIY